MQNNDGCFSRSLSGTMVGSLNKSGVSSVFRLEVRAGVEEVEHTIRLILALLLKFEMADGMINLGMANCAISCFGLE